MIIFGPVDAVVSDLNLESGILGIDLMPGFVPRILSSEATYKQLPQMVAPLATRREPAGCPKQVVLPIS